MLSLQRCNRLVATVGHGLAALVSAVDLRTCKPIVRDQEVRFGWLWLCCCVCRRWRSLLESCVWIHTILSSSRVEQAAAPSQRVVTSTKTCCAGWVCA